MSNVKLLYFVQNLSGPCGFGPLIVLDLLFKLADFVPCAYLDIGEIAGEVAAEVTLSRIYATLLLFKL